MTAFAELEVVAVPDRESWRRWLARHHATAPGALLVLPRLRGAGALIGYEEAVEEALCFGWIDGRQVPDTTETVRQHFSPRRPGGTWSRSNKERVERMELEGRMTDAGRRVVDAARRDGSWTLLDDIDAMVVPDDLAAALADNPVAEAAFKAFSPSARRAYLWWVKSARREATRVQRVADTVWLAERGIREPRRRA